MNLTGKLKETFFGKLKFNFKVYRELVRVIILNKICQECVLFSYKTNKELVSSEHGVFFPYNSVLV